MGSQGEKAQLKTTKSKSNFQITLKTIKKNKTPSKVTGQS